MAEDHPRHRGPRHSGMPGGQSHQSGSDEEITMSQVPLPPLTPPDPLAGTFPPPAAPFAAPFPSGGMPGAAPLPRPMPPLVGQAPAVATQWSDQPGSVAPTPAQQSGISMAWAVQTSFVLVLTITVLLVVLVATTASAVHSAQLVGWTMAIVVTLAVIYIAVVFFLARRSPAGGRMRWPFSGPSRQP